jgi:GTP pyrophosphokinase
MQVQGVFLAGPRCDPEIVVQPADYSFYQRMRSEAINETFLWEHRLIPVLAYLPADQVLRVREALSLAFDAHKGQRRKSGEPFISHPVEVTRILAELQMDWECLAAGLLHDTVEDCGDAVELDEIGFAFGAAVRRIVEGETKFSKLPTHHPERAAAVPASSGVVGNGSVSKTENEQQQVETAAQAKAQDLQFLFLAMTEEVRIIVVKLADRLHNMRTMGAMPPAKQRRIAQETLTVFAPLARLLGLYTIKEELEELSFKYAMPTQCGSMRRAATRVWDAQRPAMESAAATLQRRLSHDPFLAERLLSITVVPCRKPLYALWRKLQEAGRSTRDVTEVAHLQVILDPVTEVQSQTGAGIMTAPSAITASDKQLCYHVMGLIHSFWAPVPGCIKDYIATPKPNNYQSLHTTVLPTGLAALSRTSACENGSIDMEEDVDNNAEEIMVGDSGSRRRALKTGPALFPIEVQIRTAEMERLARFGIAVESWSCADYGRAVGPGSMSGVRNGSVPDNVNGNGLSGSTTTDAQKSNGSGSNGNGNDSTYYAQGLVIGEWSVDEDAYDDEEDVMSSNGSSSNGAMSDNVHAAPTMLAGSFNGSSGSNGRLDSQTMSRRINWLNSIRQWQEEFVDTLTAQEFVACVTDDLLGQGVFVFTPSGQVMRLPKGATVVDFAYHIHTDVGNTMVAARVNGKVVNVEHELANAEVVEVITYKGPVNATIIKRHQRWLAAARTKTARHKLAKFLREHAALAAASGLSTLPRRGDVSQMQGDAPGTEIVWLLARCDDRQGLLADIANVIARHGHNIRSYSGSADRDAALFIMEYELEGSADKLRALCGDLGNVPSVQGWAVGCSLQS